MSPRNRIVVGEDDNAVRHALSEYLKSERYEVFEATTCRGVKEVFRNCRPDAAILDYALPDGTALDLLPHLKRSHPGVPLILLTGNGSIQLAVQAMKEGAYQFLTKPVQMPAIASILDGVLEGLAQHANRNAHNTLDQMDPFLGEGQAVAELADEARQVCGSHYPVLIVGETGVGKGVLARWLHRQGPRAQEPFVDLNCAGLGRELLETELFGHEAGAFTGAIQRKIGLLEVAQKGTAFLDEIGDMDLQVQPKLLKVLEEKKFRRLGDIHERSLDIRLVSASHQDMGQLLREKRFRHDLYFRVSTLVLRIPPLRERSADIPLMAQRFLENAMGELGRSGMTLSDSALSKLKSYSWPGNIRELRNVIDRAALMATASEIRPENLRLEFGRRTLPNDDEASLTLKEVQRLHIQRTLAAEHGNIARTAARLGVTRSSFYNKLKSFGVERVSH